ncbi:hypothetical protein ACKWTF_002693 [Chironomus riparius]
MSLSEENNDYPEDIPFKKLSSLLPAFKKKRKRDKNNAKELSKKEENIQNDNKSMNQEPVECELQRVDKFKSEIYEEMLLLIYQDEHNLSERSYKLKHLKDAFWISEENHNEILEKVEHQLSENKDTVVQDECSSTDSKFYLLPEKVNIENIDVHSALLQIFLRYDLQYLNIQHNHWSGEFCNMVQKLLSLHAKARNLDETHILYAKWIAYIDIHHIYPLNLITFSELLNSLTEGALQEPDDLNLRVRQTKFGFRKNSNLFSDLINLVSFGYSKNIKSGITETDAANIGKSQLKYVEAEVVKGFWRSTEKLVEIFSKFISNLHFESIDNGKVNQVDILKEIFQIFDKIDSINVSVDKQPIMFKEYVKESLHRGAIEHLTRHANQNLLKHGNRNDLRIDELISLMNLSQRHLVQFTLQFGEILESYLKIDFLEYIYRIYDSELTVIIKPIVLSICDTKEGNIDNFASVHEVVAGKLFILYCELKKYADFGVEKYTKCDYDMSEYYSWFLAKISKWRKLSVFSVLPRLERAIEADTLRPDNEENKFSSSAMDLLELLDDIKTFWEYLQKAGSEEDYIKFIVGDIYRFTTKYFQQFVKKVESSFDVNDFDRMTSNLSVVLANYNHILEKIIHLQIDLTKDTEHAVSNAQNIISYTVEYMETAIKQLIIAVTKKYYTSIRDNIIIDTKINDSAASDDKIMEIRSESVEFIEKCLKVVPENAYREYEILKNKLWDGIYEITYDMIKDANHPPLFYSRLKIVFSKLKEVFYGADIPPEITKKIKTLDYYLECYKHSLARLIHEYYKERFIVQQGIKQNVANSLTINSFFSDTVLTLKIISKNEIFECNKKYDPLITIKIIPEKHFPNHQNFKLKLFQNSYEPIKIQLTQDQHHMKDAIIYFRIENKSLVRARILLGEAFLSFEHIPINNFKMSIENIHLMINNLPKEDLKSLEPIRKEGEKGNKEAKKFLEMIKTQV